VKILSNLIRILAILRIENINIEKYTKILVKKLKIF